MDVLLGHRLTIQFTEITRLTSLGLRNEFMFNLFRSLEW